MEDGGAADSRLFSVLREVTALQEALNSAVAEGDADTAERLLAELSVLERRRNRLVHRTVDSSPSYTTVRPLRDQVIQVLQLLGRPAALGLVNDVASARWGEPIPTRRMASLRRDEQASYDTRPGARPVYIAAALSADRFAAIRGVLTLSSWPLEVRIVGPASPRVDLLHNLRRLADEVDVGSPSDEVWVPALERVVVRLARTVPTALPGGSSVSVDTDRVRQACDVELAALEAADLDARAQAADRARSQLGQDQQLFGVRMEVLRGARAAGGAP